MMIDITDFNKKQIIYFSADYGDKVGIKNDNIIIYDKERNVKHQSSCYRLFIIYIVGNISITSALIEKSVKFGFYICMMKNSTKVYQFFGNNVEGNTLLKHKQYSYDRLDIGKNIVRNKIINQRNTLKLIRGKDVSIKNCIVKLDGYINELDNKSELASILGIEGLASKIYFKQIFNNINWQGRKPRVKFDYINSILDIGYTVLFNFIESILRIYGFDIYQGVLHKRFYMRKSLVCDIMEPFRVLIDMQVRKSINLGQFKEEDFMVFNNRYNLEYKNSKKYSGVFVKVMLDNREEMFRYIQSYYRYFMRMKSGSKMPYYIEGGKNDSSKL